ATLTARSNPVKTTITSLRRWTIRGQRARIRINPKLSYLILSTGQRRKGTEFHAVWGRIHPAGRFSIGLLSCPQTHDGRLKSASRMNPAPHPLWLQPGIPHLFNVDLYLAICARERGNPSRCDGVVLNPAAHP